MRHSLLFLGFLAFACVSCAKKEPDAAATSAVVEVKPPRRGHATTTSLPATAGDSQDLALQLRNPDLLNQLEGAEQQAAKKEPNKVPGSKPIIIKGSDSPPAIPTDPKPTPSPPISKPEVPSANDANATKNPGTGN